MIFEILKSSRVIIGNQPIDLKKGDQIEITNKLDIDNLLRVGYIKKKEPTEREKLIAEAEELNLQFAKNISNVKLQELIDNAKLNDEAEIDNEDNIEQ